MTLRTVANELWVDELVGHLDAGKPLNLACQLLGMSYSTVRRQVLRDPELAARLRSANARRSVQLWEKIDQLESYPGEWKKHAWKLEKSNPEFRETKEVNAQVDQAITVLLDRLEGMMPPESYGHLLDAVAELERQQHGAPAVLTVEAEK